MKEKKDILEKISSRLSGIEAQYNFLSKVLEDHMKREDIDRQNLVEAIKKLGRDVEKLSEKLDGKIDGRVSRRDFENNKNEQEKIRKILDKKNEQIFSIIKWIIITFLGYSITFGIWTTSFLYNLQNGKINVQTFQEFKKDIEK